MAKYTVRVELHDAGYDDYVNLHAFMERQGFERFITDSNGITYRLPTAEYSMAGNGDKYAVLAKAELAAKQTGKRYMVLVTASEGRTWANLPASK